jgi:hypothetical protein
MAAAPADTDREHAARPTSRSGGAAPSSSVKTVLLRSVLNSTMFFIGEIEQIESDLLCERLRREYDELSSSRTTAAVRIRRGIAVPQRHRVAGRHPMTVRGTSMPRGTRVPLIPSVSHPTPCGSSRRC